MMIFRIVVTLPNGKRLAGIGYFLDQVEAVEQTLADYPTATKVKTKCLTQGGRA